jgi:hypothetical protein
MMTMRPDESLPQTATSSVRDEKGSLKIFRRRFSLAGTKQKPVITTALLRLPGPGMGNFGEKTFAREKLREGPGEEVCFDRRFTYWSWKGAEACYQRRCSFSLLGIKASNPLL